MGMPFKIKIWNNQVTFESNTGEAFGLAFATVPVRYSGSVPTTALRESDCIVFKFGQSELDVEGLFYLLKKGGTAGVDWSEVKHYNEINLDDFSQSFTKSSIFGKALDGPFAEAARRLKLAGASALYGVKSPKTVLFSWTASDLAKYCDRLALGIQRGVVKN